jgi:uncharacterized cupin superfamily protein
MFAAGVGGARDHATGERYVGQFTSCAQWPEADHCHAHPLVNRNGRDAIYLEIGDRTPGGAVIYPDDKLVAQITAASRKFKRKDGAPHY